SNSIATTLVWKAVTSGPDAGITEVYTMGTVSTAHNNPHVVSAVVTNGGTTVLNSVPVVLSVTGSNTFTNTVTIPTLAVGASMIVSFPGYSNTTSGTNTVTVSVNVTSDSNPANNSKVVTQLVTPGNQSYAYGTTAS